MRQQLPATAKIHAHEISNSMGYMYESVPLSVFSIITYMYNSCNTFCVCWVLQGRIELEWGEFG